MASASRIVARVVNGLVNGVVNGLSTRRIGREGTSCHLAKPPQPHAARDRATFPRTALNCLGVLSQNPRQFASASRPRSRFRQFFSFRPPFPEAQGLPVPQLDIARLHPPSYATRQTFHHVYLLRANIHTPCHRSVTIPTHICAIIPSVHLLRANIRQSSTARN